MALLMNGFIGPVKSLNQVSGPHQSRPFRNYPAHGLLRWDCAAAVMALTSPVIRRTTAGPSYLGLS